MLTALAFAGPTKAYDYGVVTADKGAYVVKYAKILYTYFDHMINAEAIKFTQYSNEQDEAHTKDAKIKLIKKEVACIDTAQNFYESYIILLDIQTKFGKITQKNVKKREKIVENMQTIQAQRDQLTTQLETLDGGSGEHKEDAGGPIGDRFQFVKSLFAKRADGRKRSDKVGRSAKEDRVNKRIDEMFEGKREGLKEAIDEIAQGKLRKTEERFRQEYLHRTNDITNAIGNQFVRYLDQDIRTSRRDMLESVEHTEFKSKFVTFNEVRAALVEGSTQEAIPDFRNLFEIFRYIFNDPSDFGYELREKLYLSVPVKKEILEYISLQHIDSEKIAFPFSTQQLTNFTAGIQSGVVKFFVKKAGKSKQLLVLKDLFPLENLVNTPPYDRYFDSSLSKEDKDWLLQNINAAEIADTPAENQALGPTKEEYKAKLKDIHFIQKDLILSRKMTIRGAQNMGMATGKKKWSDVLNPNGTIKRAQVNAAQPLDIKQIAKAHRELYRPRKLPGGKLSCAHLEGKGNDGKHLKYRLAFRRKAMKGLVGVRKKYGVCVPDVLGNLTTTIQPSLAQNGPYNLEALKDEQDIYHIYRDHRKNVIRGAGLQQVQYKYKEYVLPQGTYNTVPEFNAGKQTIKADPQPYLQNYFVDAAGAYPGAPQGGAAPPVGAPISPPGGGGNGGGGPQGGGGNGGGGGPQGRGGGGGGPQGDGGFAAAQLPRSYSRRPDFFESQGTSKKRSAPETFPQGPRELSL